MKILGLGDHIDAGSALLEDGKVVSAVNDERLVREKMVFGVPRLSIRENMRIADVSPADIDAVAIGTKRQHIVPEYTDFRDGWFGLERSWFKDLLFDVGSHAARFRDSLPWLEDIYYLIRKPAYANRRNTLREILRDEFGIEAPVHFIDHHTCHATAAYYSSNFGPNATVLTIDGGGDGISAKAFDVTDGKLTQLTEVPSFDSLGAFYSYVTEISGFKAGRHEGKITGLSARGEPKYVDLLDSLITYRDGKFHNVGNFFFHSGVEELRDALPDDFDRKDLAASIQQHTENMVVDFARHWVEETGHPDVALAGGLFANVRINQEIHELPEVRRCFVHPGMSDCGMGIGAALELHYDQEPRPETDTRCMDHVYLGPDYSVEDMEEALDEADVDYERPDDLAASVAELLADGAVVARFAGRMEYGPRALGNRTIMYQPTDPSVNDWLNEALDRTEFMPFAPATLEEEAERCYRNMEGAERTARFMTITFDCTEWMQENCPGVVHVDGTARPQIVREEDNPAFHRIIREYYRITGLPSIINTSFNLHEEPIVCTPEDAVRAFQLGHLDYLAMGPFLARNPAPIQDERRRESGVKKDRVRAEDATAGSSTA